jgi:inosose dehydratase
MKIGTAPDSWGIWFAKDDHQMPWSRCLDEMAEAGYEWIELGPYGYFPTEPEQLARELTSRQLRLCAGYVMFDLEDEAAWSSAEELGRETAKLVREVGGSYLVVIDDIYTELWTGKQRISPTLSSQGWSCLVNSVKRLMEIGCEAGLKVVFHPHAQTHVEFEGHIDRLLDDIPELSLCLDVGHHAYCGGDPVLFFQEYAGRIDYLHLKNIKKDFRSNESGVATAFATAVRDEVFVEPSEGEIDFCQLRGVIGNAQYTGFAIVEQDMYPADFDRPLPVAKRTRSYLTKVGYG